MPKYITTAIVKMGGKVYDPGAEIELSKEQAAQMPWAVRPAKTLQVEAPAADEQPAKEPKKGK